MIEPVSNVWASALDDLLANVGEEALTAEDLVLAPILSRYHAHIQAAPHLDLDEIGEFVAAASRLMVLKSSRLLSQPEQVDTCERIEEEPAWLEAHALSELASQLRRTEGVESVALSGSPSPVERRAAPRPVSVLQRAWRDLSSRRTDERVTVHVPAFVRLESAVSTLIRRLKQSARIRFDRLVEGGSRSDAVIQFLAVLELVRRRTATAEQGSLFGELIVELQESDSDRATRAG